MNAKRKGNKGELEFSKWLREQGFKAWRDSGSGSGINKGDINNTITLAGEGICFEVKTVAKINLIEAWRQVNRDASLSHTCPVLAIHFNNQPKMAWLMVLSSDDFVALLKNQVIP